ncbi:flavodoxin family protein [Undibacterium sp.]|uniref:flavodoxin family protein n=1 Tax=Undibacterium sp. TaxID=1914977 RepID=UPI00374C92CF
MNIAKVVIVYHSGYGHTARQANAVLQGVKSVAGVDVLLVEASAENFPWSDLEDADAIIFGCPTYMGGPSAVFKAFQEATSKTVFAAGFKWKDKFAAGFTNSAARSGDKLATLQQFAIFAAQHGMHWINLGLPPGNNSSAGSEQDLNRLGVFMGAAAQSNADQSAEIAPPESDLLTAQHLGNRVATVVLQYVHGRR